MTPVVIRHSDGQQDREGVMACVGVGGIVIRVVCVCVLLQKAKRFRILVWRNHEVSKIL